MGKKGRLSAAYRLAIAFALLLGIALIGKSLQAAGITIVQVRLPKLANPYCDVATHLYGNLPEQATSVITKDGVPMIVVSSAILAENPSYTKFLLAHECCHHRLGHLKQQNEGLGHLGLRPFYYIRPKLRQMELDADSCAVETLKAEGEAAAIEAARQAMFAFGDKPTGAYYPTGIERADNITRVADR